MNSKRRLTPRERLLQQTTRPRTAKVRTRARSPGRPSCAAPKLSARSRKLWGRAWPGAAAGLLLPATCSASCGGTTQRLGRWLFAAPHECSGAISGDGSRAAHRVQGALPDGICGSPGGAPKWTLLPALQTPACALQVTSKRVPRVCSVPSPPADTQVCQQVVQPTACALLVAARRAGLGDRVVRLARQPAPARPGTGLLMGVVVLGRASRASSSVPAAVAGKWAAPPRCAPVLTRTHPAPACSVEPPGMRAVLLLVVLLTLVGRGLAADVSDAWSHSPGTQAHSPGTQLPFPALMKGRSCCSCCSLPCHVFLQHLFRGHAFLISHAENGIAVQRFHRALCQARTFKPCSLSANIPCALACMAHAVFG